MNEVNGFKILEDFGIDEKRVWRVLVTCKACLNPFKTSYYSLKKIKGCGCNRPKKLMPLPAYINGFKTLKCFGYDKEKGVRWALVECKECKREYEVDPNKLQYRKHCGCLKMGQKASKYSQSHPSLMNSYHHMKKRCYKKGSQDFYNYGGRGIKVCDEWLNDSNAFCEWSLENGYKEGLSIDRKDNKKGYSPENCKWSNAKEQGRNTRRVILSMDLARAMRKDLRGMTQREAAKKYKVSFATVGAVKTNIVWRED